MRNVNRTEIEKNGISVRRSCTPADPKAFFVTNKLVNDIVVLTPANITAIISISWLPNPVNFTLDENGVIKAHPATVNVLSEHFVK